MQCTLYVYCLRVSASANQLEVAGLLLLLTLYITSCSDGFDVTDVYLTGSDSGNRALMNLIHYSRNPSLIAGDQLRCTRSYFLVLREEHGYIAVSGWLKSACNCIMLKSIILSIDLHSILKGSNHAGLSILKNCHLISMAQETGIISPVSVKYIMLHVVFSSFFRLVVFIIFRIVIDNRSDHCINCCFLFLSEGIKHLRDGFIITILLLRIFFLHFFILLSFIVGMLQITHDHFIVSDEHARLTVAMCHNIIDKCSRICTCKYETHFSNNAMYNVATSLLQLIGENRKRLHIAVFNKLSCSLSRFCIIKFTICIHAFVSVFEISVSKDISRIAMPMHPY